MSESGKSGGSGSGRRRRRRRNRGRKKGKSSGSRNRSNSGKSRNRNRGKSNKRRGGSGRKQTPKEKFGGRDPKNVSSDNWEAPAELTAFDLFCSYHLGIFENNSYRDPSLKQVAKLFGRSYEDIRDALNSCGLDDDTIRQADYDLSLARLDVKVAPDGIDKRELAKNLFDEFVAAHPGFVEWTESDSTEELEESA